MFTILFNYVTFLKVYLNTFYSKKKKTTMHGHEHTHTHKSVNKFKYKSMIK